jgi:arabinose-5-phosphate isomerase
VSPSATPHKFIELALAVIEIEAAAVAGLSSRIDEKFVQACELLLACQGRIVVTGMGKSGHIGSKIAATLASTGSPAFFVHPGEASHGDMGMITPNDVVVAISYSGNTHEILTLLPIIKRLGVPLVSITGNPSGSIAAAATVNLNIQVAKEACPLGLAPTASTTATLAMGDALAVALLDARGFTVDDFAFSHPGGILGKRLLLKVDDLMQKGDAIPRVPPETSLALALLEMTEKKVGMTTVVSPDDHLLGIFTDGDLRRALTQQADLQQVRIETLMTRGSKTIAEGSLAVEALNIMERHKIMALVVVNANAQVVGVIHMHHILQAGV